MVFVRRCLQLALRDHGSLIDIPVGILKLFKGNAVAIKLALVLLLTVGVQAVVLASVGPDVHTLAVLLAVFPEAFVALAIWVVKCALTIAVIHFEIAVVGLTISPHVDSFARFAATLERTVVETTIRPLVKTFATHRVVREWPLEHFTLGCDSAAPPVDLTLSEVALENRVVRVNFEPIAIRLTSLLVHLPAVHRTRLALVEVKPQTALGVHLSLVGVPILKVVKRTQLAINVLYHFIVYVLGHVFIIIERKAVVNPFDIRVDSFTKVHLDLGLSPGQILADNPGLRQVECQTLKTRSHRRDSPLELDLFVVELY